MIVQALDDKAAPHPPGRACASPFVPCRGPGESSEPGIYEDVNEVLERTFGR